jgi:hypothetical protein
MAVTVSRPSGRRADDVRSLRFRFRTFTFSGTYSTATGETITAKSVGLFRFLGVIPLDSLVRAPAGVTGVIPVFDLSTDGKTLTIRMLEDAGGAAQAPIGAQKDNGEAYIASSKIDLLLIGE